MCGGVGLQSSTLGGRGKEATEGGGPTSVEENLMLQVCVHFILEIATHR